MPDLARIEQLDPLRLSGLYRWGVAVARHRRAVLRISLLILVLCAAMAPVLQKALGPPEAAIAGSESVRVEKLIEKRFPKLGSEQDVLVFHSIRYIASDPTYRAIVAAVVGAVRGQRGVRGVLGPYDAKAVGQILDNEHTALALTGLSGNPRQRFDNVPTIQKVAARASGEEGVQVWWTGASPILKDLGDVQKTDTERAEAIGLPVAFVVLLLALGALVAAVLPMLMAVAGLLLADGVLTLLTTQLNFDGSLLAIVTLIGLGVGIDYSLFIVWRFREALAHGDQDERDEPECVADAVGVALATSGYTVLFSGAVAALSLASMFVVNSNIFQEIAVGAVVVVACTLVVALTLLPAALALLGSRINKGALPARLRPASVRSTVDGPQVGGWARWARLVMRRPLLSAGLAVLVLAAASAPVLHLHYGFNMGVLQDASTPSGKGEKLLARTLSPGVVAPIQVLITTRAGSRTDTASVNGLDQELERDHRVTAVVETPGKSAVLLAVVPSVAIDSPAATALVWHIRKDLVPAIERRGGPTVLVGGATARSVENIDELRAKFPLILGFVLSLSLLFLLVIFRSVVLPIKAVLMNLLATGASIGLVIWVFQDGHGQHLLNFTSTGFIQSTTPLIMFALLFGLSMDYEVFLIRRMQEEWRRTGENRSAVANGIERTARPITAAAAIMVAVFGCSVVANLLELKQLGFALAIAIAIDATIIRLVLVPAAMCLFGSWNWWLPRRLERVLPRLGAD
ncbi:MAG TPA: MMPL family transporter [Solirubrobacteraceae bacterium]|jgi:RND superfamily putative drug exporter|nr:MMPL family transporter [Solirubrobacteraceae bacterium]